MRHFDVLRYTVYARISGYIYIYIDDVQMIEGRIKGGDEAASEEKKNRTEMIQSHVAKALCFFLLFRDNFLH